VKNLCNMAWGGMTVLALVLGANAVIDPFSAERVLASEVHVQDARPHDDPAPTTGGTQNGAGTAVTSAANVANTISGNAAVVVKDGVSSTSTTPKGGGKGSGVADPCDGSQASGQALSQCNEKNPAAIVTTATTIVSAGSAAAGAGGQNPVLTPCPSNPMSLGISAICASAGTVTKEVGSGPANTPSLPSTSGQTIADRSKDNADNSRDAHNTLNDDATKLLSQLQGLNPMTNSSSSSNGADSGSGGSNSGPSVTVNSNGVTVSDGQGDSATLPPPPPPPHLP
jgi:hypothetical protein